MTAIITESELEVATLRFLGKPENFHTKVPGPPRVDWFASRRFTFLEWKARLRTVFAGIGVEVQEDAAEWIAPEWSKAGKIHDWRNHVTEPVQAIWHTFTIHQRKVLYEVALSDAAAEEWD